ncbi:MAG: response regulator, partial [Cyanobacteria bacterium J06648_10]
MSNHKRALSGICVLLVDDEPDSRELTSFVLQQAGAKVVSTSSGAEALAAISLQVPDLVISDVGMPEVDGYMLMRQIRQLPAAKGGCVPAIALTAYAGEANIVS